MLLMSKLNFVIMLFANEQVVESHMTHVSFSVNIAGHCNGDVEEILTIPPTRVYPAEDMYTGPIRKAGVTKSNCMPISTEAALRMRR